MSKVQGHEVIFSHSEVDKTLGKLVVLTGANQITWSYGLNTQSYPTYAGEVVQILSAYTDVLHISGDVVSYSQMEHIYEWFLRYISIATQGYNANPGNRVTSYNEEPVSMSYPHRGWNLKIKPLHLPGLRYGREVVVPTWSLEAHVVEEEAEMLELAKESALLGEFDKLDAGIGFREHNPFSDPDFQPAEITKFLGNGAEPVSIHKLTDWYNSLIPAYISGDTSGLTQSSHPAAPYKSAEIDAINAAAAGGGASTAIPGADIATTATGAGWMPGVNRASLGGGTPWKVECPPKGVLHTTEGDNPLSKSAWAGNDGAPHFQVARDGTIDQLFPITTGSTALENHPGGVETNGAHAIQIEVVGHAVSTFWPQAQIAAVKKVMRWIETNAGVPKSSGVNFVSGGSARMSGPEWIAYTGWCGHQHVPENDHVDPGAININNLLQ